MKATTEQHSQIVSKQCKILSTHVLQAIYMQMSFVNSVWKYVKYEWMCHAKP